MTILDPGLFGRVGALFQLSLNLGGSSIEVHRENDCVNNITCESYYS